MIVVAIAEAVPLAPRTTLGIGGPARRLARASSLEDLRAALAAAGDDDVLILGGGSNLVVRDGGFDGLVIEPALLGVDVARAGDHAVVTARAGVVWDDLVAEMVGAGLAGVECLSGIPGWVGATPMQNVGAYGQEVADTIACVRALDRATGAIVDHAPAACGFGYRTSAFRGGARWVIVEVVFRLARRPESAPVRYPELARALGVAEGGRAPLAVVRDAVIALRRGKGMVVDPGDPESRSAGSFFTNPIVDHARADALAADHPDLPRFAAPDGRVKLAAAWLIERAGFGRGLARDGIGISRKHALALVHRGGGTARGLLALAAEIQAAVRARFGIALALEPIVVGSW